MNFFNSFIVTILLFSCGNTESKEDSDTTKVGNIYTTASTDFTKLSKIISIDLFKPRKVKVRSFFDEFTPKYK